MEEGPTNWDHSRAYPVRLGYQRRARIGNRRTARFRQQTEIDSCFQFALRIAARLRFLNCSSSTSRVSSGNDRFKAFRNCRADFGCSTTKSAEPALRFSVAFRSSRLCFRDQINWNQIKSPLIHYLHEKNTIIHCYGIIICSSLSMLERAISGRPMSAVGHRTRCFRPVRCPILPPWRCRRSRMPVRGVDNARFPRR